MRREVVAGRGVEQTFVFGQELSQN
jgi:hypothetical protein